MIIFVGVCGFIKHVFFLSLFSLGFLMLIKIVEKIKNNKEIELVDHIRKLKNIKFT